MTVQTTTLTHGQRRAYEGVLQILRFNYPMFIWAVLGLAAGAGLLAFAPMPRLAGWAIACVMAMAGFWAVATLAVSHLVYDRSAAFTFTWLAPHLTAGCRWVNVHAGFDQTSEMLRRALPRAFGVPVDLYDPGVMTERSIHRARSSLRPIAGTLQGQFDRLPARDASGDAVLLLFAAHELRARVQRVALFREAVRTLRPGGMVALVEHLRGVPNFLAFGPGTFHFFARHEWLLAGESAGLELVRTESLTPFATAFIWRKAK